MKLQTNQTTLQLSKMRKFKNKSNMLLNMKKMMIIIMNIPQITKIILITQSQILHSILKSINPKGKLLQIHISDRLPKLRHQIEHLYPMVKILKYLEHLQTTTNQICSICYNSQSSKDSMVKSLSLRKCYSKSKIPKCYC